MASGGTSNGQQEVAGPGKGLGSRKASFASASGHPSASKLMIAGTTGIFGKGNVSGGGGILGQTRQRTSSLFASLTSPFGLGGGASRDAGLQPQPSPMSPSMPGSPFPRSAGPTRPFPRHSTDRPESRNRALSVAKIDRTNAQGQFDAGAMRSPRISRSGSRGQVRRDSAAELLADASRTPVVQQGSTFGHERPDAGPERKQEEPTTVVAAAAAAAVDAIKARDTEAQEDLRYFLLGEGNPAGPRRPPGLKHYKSEERLGRPVAGRESLQLEPGSRPRSRTQLLRAPSRDQLKAGLASGAGLSSDAGAKSADAAQSFGEPRSSGQDLSGSMTLNGPDTSVLSATSSFSSAPYYMGGADTSETSDLSQAAGSFSREFTPQSQLPVVGADGKVTPEIEAWAESEGPHLQAQLVRTKSRADVIKVLASASTLVWPFGDNASEGSAAPLDPVLATAVRKAAMTLYMRRFAFEYDPLDVALRKLMIDIKLPSETQQIDRVLNSFALRYMECNHGIYVTEDQPYILAFSLMMLHTDAFNRNAKHKMTKADYVKNTSTGDGLPTEILEYFYDNTTFTQFIHVDEETGQASGALPTGGPTTSNSLAAVSQLNSRSASSASLAGLPQSSAALSMSVANNSDLLLSTIGGAGGNPATVSFGSFLATGATNAGSASGGVSPQTPSAGPGSVILGGAGSKARVDPYLLIAQGNLGELRPSLDHLIPRMTPYRYSGTARTLNIGRLRRTFFHAPLLEIHQSHRRPSVGAGLTPNWSTSDVLGGGPAIVDFVEAVATFKIPKAGILLRKDDIPLAPPIGNAGGEPAKVSKKAHGRKWKKYGLVLSGSQALFFRDFVWTAALESQMEEQAGEWWADPDLLPQPVHDYDDADRASLTGPTAPVEAILQKRSVTISPRVSHFKPDDNIPLHDAVAVRDESCAAEGEWIFRLTFRLPLGMPTAPTMPRGADAAALSPDVRHFLLQAASEQDMNEWIGLINYCASYRSVGDRRLEVHELAKIVCETGGPSQSLNSKERPGGLRRAGSTLRQSDALGALPQAMPNSSTNTSRAASRKNSTAAELSAAGYHVSPVSTMQKFVAQAKSALDEANEQLETELRVARHFGMLTPFQRATRERIEAAAIPLGERVRERRLQVAKCKVRLEILTADLQHVIHVAPSPIVFIQNPRNMTQYEDNQEFMYTSRSSIGDDRLRSYSNESGRLVDDAGEPSSLDLQRVSSTPPQLDIEVLGGGGRLSLFGSDRSISR